MRERYFRGLRRFVLAGGQGSVRCVFYGFGLRQDDLVAAEQAATATTAADGQPRRVREVSPAELAAAKRRLLGEMTG